MLKTCLPDEEAHYALKLEVLREMFDKFGYAFDEKLLIVH